jgi:undecaprenyl-phosphate 4-deoxy-4-formamido-L-arabinose transferase
MRCDAQDAPALQGLSVVVPVYNSEASLAMLVGRLAAVLPSLADHFELILVNDGSSDGSWGGICGHASRLPWVRGINLMRNYGQHNAVLCGVRAAQYDITVTMDDDLQHPPEEIPALLAKLAEGCDVVYGCPLEEQHGLARDLASVLTKIALRTAMGVDVARSVSAFRAFRTEVRRAFKEYRHPHVSFDVLLSWATDRFARVRVRHDARAAGESHYTFRKLATHAFNMITGYSTAPLQFASLLGFIMAVFGFAVLAWVIGRVVLQGIVMPGFAFLASIIAIFSGAQLFTLGIIGEYLTRLHQRALERPTYVILEEAGAPPETLGEGHS